MSVYTQIEFKILVVTEFVLGLALALVLMRYGVQFALYSDGYIQFMPEFGSAHGLVLGMYIFYAFITWLFAPMLAVLVWYMVDSRVRRTPFSQLMRQQYRICVFGAAFGALVTFFLSLPPYIFEIGFYIAWVPGFVLYTLFKSLVWFVIMTVVFMLLRLASVVRGGLFSGENKTDPQRGSGI